MANAFRKEYLKRWIAYFTMCCVVFASQQPSKLIAQDCGTCTLVEPEDACRTKTATIVAGATLVALVGGIAYLVLASSSCHGHSHSSSSSSSYSSSYSNYDPPFPSYSYSSYSEDSYGRHHHRHHHRHSNKSSDYSSSSFWSGSDYYSDYHSGSDPQIFERNGGEGNHPARTRQLACSKKSKETDQISGVFITHPSLSSAAKGSVTAFVQMPDGTTQVLGSLSFSASGGSSLAYGPFTQKGNYLFGIRIDEGTTLSSQAKVGSVEVNINGSTVESRDFFVPVHAPSHYEPTPCEYCL